MLVKERSHSRNFQPFYRPNESYSFVAGHLHREEENKQVPLDARERTRDRGGIEGVRKE